MKIKKQIEQIEGVELVEKADKGVLLVYLKQQISNKDLFELAKGMYPVGTKFIDLENGAIRTVSGDEHIVSDHEVNCGATPANEWITNNDWSNPFLYLDGRWAEIVHPLFTTSDGVEIYMGDRYWLAADGVDGILTCIANGAHDSDNHFFSSEASAQAWIDSQKPMVFVDGEIYTSKNINDMWIFRFRSIRHAPIQGDVAAYYYSRLNNDNEYNQNDWLVVSGYDRTVAIASLEEKKQLITAEIHNNYFHGL